jgi:hypothetical protein
MQQLWREQFTGPLRPPTSMFNATVYDKGAWVLHMLRRVMGDDAFFNGLEDWYQSHRDATGTSEQLRLNMERWYTGTLDWFFQQWVFGAGSPRYEYGWSVANRGPAGYRVYVRILQTQTNAGPFTMPIDLELMTPSQSVYRTVWSTGVDQDFVFDLSEPVTTIFFDTDNWVLKASVALLHLPDIDVDGVPDRADNCLQSWNPDQADLDGDAQGNACDGDDDGDGLLDAQDCASLDVSQGRPPASFSVVMGKPSPSISTISWLPLPMAERYDVVRGPLVGLRVGNYGSCMVTSLTTTSWSDGSRPLAGSGYFYLVRGVDSGCGGAGYAGVNSQGAPIPSACP